MALNSLENQDQNQDDSYSLPVKHHIKKMPVVNYNSNGDKKDSYLPKLNGNASSDNLLPPDIH